MNIVLLIFQVCLAVYLLTLLWCLLGLFRPEPGRTADQPTVAVIVAAKDGGPYLPRLLDQLQAQDYPPALLEIILVDDGLSEPARSTLETTAARDSRLKVISSSSGDARLAHKKRALDAGISHSQGELLLFTDVDCQVGPAWVGSMVSYFTPRVDFLIGWSQVGAQPGLAPGNEQPEGGQAVTLFEQLGFVMLMLAAGAPPSWVRPGPPPGKTRPIGGLRMSRPGGFWTWPAASRGMIPCFSRWPAGKPRPGSPLPPTRPVG